MQTSILHIHVQFVPLTDIILSCVSCSITVTTSICLLFSVFETDYEERGKLWSFESFNLEILLQY